MKITILGSGAWAGIPVAFCRCRVCIEAQKSPYGKNNRTRPEILVEGKAGDTFLIEISPDIRTQSARFNLPDIPINILIIWMV
jgi:phosphoribosyl 1,2-cyclic phosphodiesterase